MNAHRKAAAGAQACVMIHFPGREIASTTSGRHPAEAIARMLSHLPLSLLFEVLLRLRLQDLTAVEATCTGLRDALRRADFLDAWLKASCYLRTGECTIIAAAWKRASGIHTECWTVLSVHPHRREGAVLSLPRGQSLSLSLMTALTRKGQTGVTIFTDHEVVTGGGPWGTSARERRSLWIVSTEGVRHPHCGHIYARMQFHNVRFVSEACNWWVAEDVDLIINFFDLFESRHRLPAVKFGSFPGPVVDPHVRELAWHSDGWAVGCSGDGLYVWCVSFGAERR